MKEEHILRVIANRVLRICAKEGQNNKLHNQYFLSDIIGMKKSITKRDGHAACMGVNGNAYRI
jgi:hypothetical protein